MLIRESPGVRGVSYVSVLVGCQTVCGGRDFAGLGVVFMRKLRGVIQRCERGGFAGGGSPHGAGFLGGV